MIDFPSPFTPAEERMFDLLLIGQTSAPTQALTAPEREAARKSLRDELADLLLRHADAGQAQ